VQRLPEAEIRSRVHDALALVGLDNLGERASNALSGGQQQRVAIARCLAMEPEIILFDEPTSALDPTMISEVLSVIRRLAKEGLTMAIVTHELGFARDVSNRILYMDEGVIYEEGPPEQIFDDPQREKTQAFINRIRSYHRRLSSPDFDLYGMNAEIEMFCEKQIIPREQRDALLLVVEELLELYKPSLNVNPLDLTVAYSEKNGSLEVTAETPGSDENPLERRDLEDDLGVTIIQNLAEEIEFQPSPEGAGRLKLKMKLV